ncbi:hypothetical protein E6P09_18090 (plasmid) [Haloferax mediterranei ATCC 33500]|uniref:Uncharacterized protein n=1 Tax=Haloferax mediterranei (strain ATCC 33500 / DSM 1411 / JCM 8866 / NBRC 14739 / NCIMB 2177 / R-4) TaxID=523841 RepID=I3RA17_HALMT|nr:hypothetical protein [Haloferax mediterranei]AFK21077.1 hypothetical protein HFX_5245 [Haloferax mediterranei ATCC 33500]AHZ24067.1 hypothetical protein BM92_17825 [Haloferax mediterranei ATCC 33500]EMA05140.1 hypothetical protein C439_00035 [Haloferax mediterranei ATCC 33500]MDX5989783.1 hypothetical protein [Haloferax mediterranei ATCC 33500]QCQ77227.1 hypothetical protein E6P09_18090 [Haloferax mediterranei ATCC 33500]
MCRIEATTYDGWATGRECPLSGDPARMADRATATDEQPNDYHPRSLQAEQHSPADWLGVSA